MKIVIYDFGGYPFIFEMSCALAERGHQVTHVFSNPLAMKRCDFTPPSHLKDSLVVIETKMSGNYESKKTSFASRFHLEWRLGALVADAVATTDAEVLVCANTPTHILQRLKRTADDRSMRFVPWIQDMYSIAVSQHLAKRLPGAGHLVGHFYQALEQRICRSSDGLILISKGFIPQMERWGIDREQLHILQNWAPLESIQPGDKHNPWAIKRGLEDKICILYSGTLGLKHSPELLYQLADSLKDQSMVRVVVLAEGTGMQELKSLQAHRPLDNLILEGLQPSEDYVQALACGDILTALLEPGASTYSAPSKVLSYLCASRPILLAAPADNLSSEIVNQSDAGRTVNPEHPNEYEQAARELIALSNLERGRLGANGRKYAEKHFNIEKLAKQFEAAISSGSKGAAQQGSEVSTSKAA